MNWKARIDAKSDLTIDGNITYTIAILGDGTPLQANVAVTGAPSDIQTLIADKVTSFATAYELSKDLPDVGEELIIIA